MIREFVHEEISTLFHLEKFYGGWWWAGGIIIIANLDITNPRIDLLDLSKTFWFHGWKGKDLNEET